MVGRIPVFGRVKDPCSDCAGDWCTMNCSSRVNVPDDDTCMFCGCKQGSCPMVVNCHSRQQPEPA